MSATRGRNAAVSSMDDLLEQQRLFDADPKGPSARVERVEKVEECKPRDVEQSVWGKGVFERDRVDLSFPSGLLSKKMTAFGFPEAQREYHSRKSQSGAEKTTKRSLFSQMRLNRQQTTERSEQNACESCCRESAELPTQQNENDEAEAMFQAMSHEEKLEMQQQLLARLPPQVIDHIKKGNYEALEASMAPVDSVNDPVDNVVSETAPEHKWTVEEKLAWTQPLKEDECIADEHYERKSGDLTCICMVERPHRFNLASLHQLSVPSRAAKVGETSVHQRPGDKNAQ